MVNYVNIYYENPCEILFSLPQNVQESGGAVEIDFGTSEKAKERRNEKISKEVVGLIFVF